MIPKKPVSSGFTNFASTPFSNPGNLANFGRVNQPKNSFPNKLQKDPLQELKNKIQENIKRFNSGDFTTQDFVQVTQDSNALAFPEVTEGFKKFEESDDFLIKFNDLAHEDIGTNGFFQLLSCLTHYIPKRWDPESELCQGFKIILHDFIDFAIQPDEGRKVDERIVNSTNLAWAQISILEFPDWDIFAELVEDQKQHGITHFINVLKIIKQFAILIDSSDKNTIIDSHKELMIRNNLKNPERAEYIRSFIQEGISVELNPENPENIQLFKASLEAFQYLLQYIDFQPFFYSEDQGETILQYLINRTNENGELFQLTVQFFAESLNQGYMDMYDMDETENQEFIRSICAKFKECLADKIIPSISEEEGRKTNDFFKKNIWAENVITSVIPSFFEEFSEVLESYENQEQLNYFMELLFFIIEDESSDTALFSQIMDNFQRILQRVRASYNKRNDSVFKAYQNHIDRIINIIVTKMVEPITIQTKENDFGEEEIFAQNETKYGDLFSTMKQALTYAVGCHSDYIIKIIENQILIPFSNLDENPIEDDIQVEMIQKLCWSVGAVYPVLNEMNDSQFTINVRNLIEDFTNAHSESPSFPGIIKAYAFFLSQGAKFYQRDNESFSFAFDHLINFLQIPDEEIKPIAIEAFTLLAKNYKEGIVKETEHGVPLMQLYEHIPDILNNGEKAVPPSTQKIFITMLTEFSKSLKDENKVYALDSIFNYLNQLIDSFDQADVNNTDDLFNLTHSLGIYDAASSANEYFERTSSQIDSTLELYNRICQRMVECLEDPNDKIFNALQMAQSAILHHYITLIDSSTPEICKEKLIPQVCEVFFLSFSDLPPQCKSTAILRMSQQCIKKIKSSFFEDENIRNYFFSNVYGHICELLNEQYDSTKIFMEYIYSVTVEMFKQCSTVFESIPNELAERIIDAIKNGYKEYDPNISNLAFDSLYEMIKGSKSCTTEWKEGFFGHFLIDFFMDPISVLTDGIHTFALPKVANIVFELRTAPTFNDRKGDIFDAMQEYFQDSAPPETIEAIFTSICDSNKLQNINDQLKILLVESHRITKFDKDLRRIKVDEFRQKLNEEINSKTNTHYQSTLPPQNSIQVDDHYPSQDQENDEGPSQDTVGNPDDFPDVSGEISYPDEDPGDGFA